ncbi:phage tail tip lysozyme [Rhizobium sp. SYY.PMSO]|uniref:phage tail tip lysozyme n=1 Tax=Rhizobium sp. SYY.PMSO TaxID=3382192 RepID=UPI00398FC676
MSDNADDLIISISADQATLRRSIQRIEQSLDGLTGSVRQKFAAVGKTIDDSVSTSMQNRINAMAGIGTKAAKEWTGALSDQGKELERLRSKYSPLFAVINQYKTNVEDIRRAHALGAISSAEYQAAMSRERQAALASTAAIKGRNVAISQTPRASESAPTSSRPWQTGNIVAQLQDIGVGAFGGQKPLTIALQQGTQLADVIQTFSSGRSAIAGLGAAFTSLVSPVSLITVGLTAGAAALIQYFTSSKNETDKAAEAIKNHAELIRRIKEAWPEAEAGLKEYAAESKKILTQDLQDSIKLYKQQIADSSRTAASTFRSIPMGDFKGATYTIEQIRSAVGQLDASISSDNPGLRKFVEQLIDIENQTGTPDNIREIIKQVRESAKAGVEAQDKLAPLVQTIEGVGMAAAAQAKNIKAFVDAVDKLGDIAPTPLTDSEKAQKIFDEAMRNARTEADVQNATDAFNSANKRISDQNPGVDMGDGRIVAVPQPAPRPNIELEGLPGEVEKQEAAEKKAATAAEELKKKQADLLKTAGDRIASIQLETSLLGKYGVAQDNARFALETWQKAEKLNLSADQKKALQDRIDQYGQLADTLARLKLSQDLNDQARLSALSKQDQQIAGTLRQYGLDDKDLSSPQAQQIRTQLVANDNRETVTSFLTEFKDGLVKNGESVGEAFGKALQNALMKQADKLWENLFNQIGNALFGGGTTATNSAAGSGVAGLGAQTVGRLLSPSSLNGSVAGQTTQTGVAAQAWNFFASKGLQPHQIAGVLGNISAESSFNPKSVGDAGKAFGLFQHHADRGGGSGLVASGASGQLQHAWNELQGPENATLKRLLAAPDVKSATAAFAGFERPRGWSLTNPEGADNFSGRLNAANEALSKFGGTTNQATQGLGALGNGLGQLGSTLGSGAGGVAAGGGGIFGWLGKLFGGGGSQFKAAQAGLLKPGLFADGGHVAGPGTSRSDSVPAWLSNGEFVVNSAATKKHRAMLEAINNGSIARFADGGLVTPRMVNAPVAPSLVPRMAAIGNDNRQPGILQVHISGASGDDHVRMLVRQGVGEGLQTYNKRQERGGFGTVQARYANQKA